MRRIPMHAAFALVLTLGLAAPAAAAQPTRCAISVAPGIGSTSDSYRITGTGFPPGSWESFTDVHIGIGRAGDGRLMPTMFLTLFPGGGGEFYVDYHFNYEGEEQLPPLEPGLYRVRAEANGHECVAVASFRVTA
ncbi:MAG: hypothetical protein ABI620_08565 [Chloroflexota bacterium]